LKNDAGLKILNQYKADYDKSRMVSDELLDEFMAEEDKEAKNKDKNK